jgi:septum formation protein
MHETQQTVSLILASSSPQRSAILAKIGIPFTVLKPMPDVEEEAVPKTVPMEKVPGYLARKKVFAAASLVPEGSGLILGADTVVILGRRIFGKPENADRAREFLRALSGRRHKVITALALYDAGAKTLYETAATTRVAVSRLTDEAIDWYIGTGEWRGAAGGYRAQGLGARFLKSMTGLESTVIGLPVYPLIQLLAKSGNL